MSMPSGGSLPLPPATPTTARSSEQQQQQQHGLSALEEGIIQQHSSGYNVFDDDRVLRICDEAEATAVDTPDGVDTLGGEEAADTGNSGGHMAAGRRWRLVQLVGGGHRRRTGSSADMGHRRSNHGSASTYSSPVVGNGGESGSLDLRWQQKHRRKRMRWWGKHRHMQSASGSGILVPAVVAQSEKPPEPKARGWWSAVLQRFVRPGGVNRFGERETGRRAEHMGFVAAFALSSVGFILWGTLVPRAVCSTSQTFTMSQIAARRFVAANGVVSDFGLAQSSFGRAMHGYSGYDITPVFPLLGLLSPGYRTPQMEVCMGNASAVDSFLSAWRSAPNSLYSGPEQQFPTLCPLPQAPQTTGAQCMFDKWPQFVAAKVGMLQLSKEDIRARGSAWILAGTQVFDTMLLKYAPADSPLVVAAAKARKGADISAAGQRCMELLLLRGTTEATQSAFACANTNVVAWVTFGTIFLVLLTRLITAEVYAAVRARQAKAPLDEESTGQQPACVVVVPVAGESAEAVASTLQSVARSAYPDTHTVLWVICDGPASLGHVLRVLAHGNGDGDGVRSDAKFYGAYGGPGGACGAARVLSGHYECGRHRIAYVVTAKEAKCGGVDSLMMAVSQFRTTSSTGGTASEGSTVFLDEEVEGQLAALGHPLHDMSLCVLVACGVQMDPQALPQFVARMQGDPRVAVVSGSLYAVGRPTSVRAFVQRADFYLQHFVAPICASLACAPCPLDQLFAIYRVRCLRRAHAHVDALVRRYAARSSGGLAWPANDCLLAPRVVAASAPSARWAFEPNARAEIRLPSASDAALRQWYRTRVLALVDAVKTAPSVSPLTVLRLLALLVTPAAISMLYVEVVLAIFRSAPAVVVCELIGAYVVASLIALLVARRSALALHWLVYCAIAVPYYSIWIPTTALLTMNRVWRAPDRDSGTEPDSSLLVDHDPDPLVQDAHRAMRRVLRDCQCQVLPDSPEFYAICERATAALIAAHPDANAQDLAHAVNRAADAAIPASQPPVQVHHRFPLPPAAMEDESDAD
ncbi:hypothetical protein IWW37_004160 [Coemansia sp. RSA 2050]|nr:hypothetical protein IWW37_004160 [Coemansia sp. RSA 2050]